MRLVISEYPSRGHVCLLCPCTAVTAPAAFVTTLRAACRPSVTHRCSSLYLSTDSGCNLGHSRHCNDDLRWWIPQPLSHRHYFCGCLSFDVSALQGILFAFDQWCIITSINLPCSDTCICSRSRNLKIAKHDIVLSYIRNPGLAPF